MAYGSSLLQALYYRLPLVGRDLMTSIYGHRQRRERYGSDYQAMVKFAEEVEGWPNEKVQSYSRHVLHGFLEYACAHVPFYEQYRSIREGVVPELNSFPVLGKSDVRRRSKEFISDELSRLRYRMGHTSGTTGSALVFPLSSECFQREYAYRTRHYAWSGVNVDRKPRIVYCSGHPVAHPGQMHPPFWTRDWSNNWMLLSSYHLSRVNLPLYARALAEFDPVLLHGYPSSLVLLADALRLHGSRLPSLRAVYASSETLFPHQRRVIENAFQVKVYAWYGNSEMVANAMECEQGEIHLRQEHSWVEIMKDNNEPAAPGDVGRILCTGYGNRAFPLIRYDIGDEVRISKNQRSICGRSGLLLDEVTGRIEDYVVTPDGRFVGRLDHIFKDSTHVEMAQIVQEGIDEITLRIVNTPAFTPTDERDILREARRRLGESIRINVEYVQDIPRDGRKYRFIVSKLPADMRRRPLGTST